MSGEAMSARIGALLFLAAIFGPAILATVLLIHLRHCSRRKVEGSR